ncbi:MAG: hypothetical protein H6732_12245 [Alphaproteobacteria bacterium]|nr:hypothetical protein [Alphaproteobacteria bacterium]
MRHALPVLLIACTPLAPFSQKGGDDTDDADRGGDSGVPTDTFGDSDTLGPGDSGDDTGLADGCRAGRPRPDASRFALVSHPVDAAGDQDDLWEVLQLGTDGALGQTGRSFRMGRGYGEPVRFAPDGSLAVAIQTDGSLSVVTLDAQGTPKVVVTGYEDDGAGGDFYAYDVLFDPGGERLWVLDGNWAGKNGGGIYALDLDCTTGMPTARGFVLPSKLGTHLFPAPGGRHLLVAKEVMDSGPSGQVHLVDLDPPTLLGSVALWADDEAIIGGAALGGDGSYVIVGDNAGFSTIENRVGVARLSGGKLTPVQVLPDLLDPIAIGTWGAATLVASGFGNGLVPLAFDAGSQPPFARRPALTTVGGPSQLPGVIEVVPAPGGDAWMLVTEVSGIRRLRATPAGEITDLGAFSFGDGLEGIVGSLGVQP